MCVHATHIKSGLFLWAPPPGLESRFELPGFLSGLPGAVCWPVPLVLCSQVWRMPPSDVVAPALVCFPAAQRPARLLRCFPVQNLQCIVSLGQGVVFPPWLSLRKICGGWCTSLSRRVVVMEAMVILSCRGRSLNSCCPQTYSQNHTCYTVLQTPRAPEPLGPCWNE